MLRGLAHAEFNAWVERVAVWLDKIAPKSGLCAEWSALNAALLLRDRVLVGDWDGFVEAVRERLRWLAALPGALPNASKTAAGHQHTKPIYPNRVFVVHGHDGGTRDTVARFLEKLSIECIILHEQPNKGRTIIEKFEDYSDVGFAVVLLTPDDKGGPADQPPQQQQPRARQNVVLELGFFLGKLGRSHVCALYKDKIEMPSDYSGVLFVSLDGADWKIKLVQELQAAGIQADPAMAFSSE